MDIDRKDGLLVRISRSYFSKRVLPYWMIILADSFIVFFSCVVTFWVSNRSWETFDNRFALLYTSLLYAALSWVGARIFKTYSGVLRYSSFVDLTKVALANLITAVLAVLSCLALRHFDIAALTALSPGETLVSIGIATLLMGAMRVTVKTLYDHVNSNSRAMRVLIYGALTGGVGVAKSIQSAQSARFVLKGFITHEHRIKGKQLMGVPVYTLEEDIASIVRREKIEAVLVSPQRVNEFRENQKIQDILIGAGVKIFMAREAQLSSVKEGALSDDDAPELQIKEVSVEDLLPRSQIQVDMASVAQQLEGKRVLITGSAGSIGSEIARQVASFKPAALMLIDQAETPQHDMRLQMKRDYPDVNVQTLVTSIDRKTRMEHVFSTFKPEYVFHAAAYKHVPMMEDNPSEAVLDNIQGTRILADLSVQYGVRKFVMISTDKAVNPTNVMGCSKRICEIYVQSLDRKQKLAALSRKPGTSPETYTQFVTTRFGNVLGSNGSVIPIFREQIKHGGPVTVTDENIVRFFMLIPEACKLVLEAGTKGNGGEIFVFDMGQPVRIADLARRMILMSGARNVEIKFTGLREGEKLYEEVLSELEGTKPTFHPKIRIAQVREYDFEDVCKDVDELVEIAKRYVDMDTVRKMKQIVPEYKSNNSPYEVLDSELGGVVQEA